MKVALVSFAFGELCASLANSLAREAEVHLMMPEPLAETAARTLDERVVQRPFAAPRLRQPAAQLRACGHVVRRLNGEPFDVVHLQQGHLWFNGFLPTIRRPLTLTVHDAAHHPGDQASRATPQRVLDFGFRRADSIIVHARDVADQLTARGIDVGSVEVIPHPPIGPVNQPATPVPDTSTVLFFGRIWPYKGLAHLIRAEPALSAEFERLKIVVAGTGEEFAPYRDLMSDPGRFEVINRFVSDDERDELMRRATVVVLPYIEASQSGVVALSYASGRPVVATTVGGLPEAIEDGETGLLVPPGDEPALTEAIARLLRDHDLAARMGAAGRRRLDAQADAQAAATITAYRRAIAAAGR